MLVLRRVEDRVESDNYDKIILWEIPILNISYEVKQDAVSVYTVEVYVGDYLNPEDDLYQDFEIWYKGELLIDCSLEEYSVDDSGVLQTLTFWDSLGKLVREVGDSSLLMPIGSTATPGIPLMYAITLILRGPVGAFQQNPSWPFQTGEMVNHPPFINDNVLVDLRQEETRFSQLIRTVSQLPETFIRNGGRVPYNQNDTFVKRYLVDIGAFGDPADFNLTPGDTLLSLRINRSNLMKIRGIEAFGGPAGDGARKLNLRDAYNYDITDVAFIAGSGYSFEGDFSGSPAPGYVVKDSVSDKAYLIRKEYPEIKLAGTPTAQEIRKAGYLLYLRTIRDIEENQESVSYTAEVVLDEEVYGAVPKRFISKNTHLTYKRRAHLLNQDTGLMEYNQESLTIDEDVRIVGYSARYENGRFLYTLELSKTAYSNVIDPDIQMYDSFSSEFKGENQEYDIDASLVFGTQLVQPVTEGPGDAPDSQMSDGRLARRFTWTIPALNTERFYAVINESPGYDWEIRQSAIGDQTGSIILVAAPKTGNWTVSDEATLTLFWTTIGP